ncbi:winged helix-turn-helix transcriptional regulator [Sandarakinorhabdus oryzae]|uniref:winged helix-turn-helix transcriptional regulator n=1 Tax=Sandarakinorhabdus oryzae TaxID=2675220 RepID=UPI0018CC603B|nr:helix-turn-helix domain-containing protein [Sandarakinorhabdus oryzae]
MNSAAPPLNLQTYSAMDCPVHGLVTILSGPWTTYILWLLRQRGPMRFGQLKKQMPAISAKVLTERLRLLEQTGILDRHQEATIPPKVTYSLTGRGQELHGALDALDALALKWSGRTAWA